MRVEGTTGSNIRSEEDPGDRTTIYISQNTHTKHDSQPQSTVCMCVCIADVIDDSENRVRNVPSMGGYKQQRKRNAVKRKISTYLIGTVNVGWRRS